MSDHTEASLESTVLCDKLYECLSKCILNLKKVQKQRWCGFYQQDRKRFAYINHRKTMSRIEVWCLGDPIELQESTRLNVEPRNPSSGGFGTQFEARFFVDSISDIDSACELLFTVSYRSSL